MRSASGMFGVTTRASGSSSRFKASSASSSIRSKPEVERTTGSTTGAGKFASRKRRATSRMISRVGSIPVFAPATLKSSTTASTCARTVSAVWCAAPKTPVVFWKVSDVTAAAAKQPKAVNVFTSATTPAPPDGSNPATVSATGMSVSSLNALSEAACPTDEMHDPSEVLSVCEEANPGDARRARPQDRLQLLDSYAAERD